MWENARGRKLACDGWVIRDSVWQTASRHWPHYTCNTLYMAHLHSTCMCGRSAGTWRLIRVINIAEQCSDPLPGASVFCSHKLSKHAWLDSLKARLFFYLASLERGRLCAGGMRGVFYAGVSFCQCLSWGVPGLQVTIFTVYRTSFAVYTKNTSDLKQPELPGEHCWSTRHISSFTKSAPGKLSAQLCLNCSTPLLVCCHFSLCSLCFLFAGWLWDW